MVSVDYFPVVTANEIPGYKILETKGFVYGLSVQSREAGNQDTVNVGSAFNGDLKELIKVIEETRDEALKRMIDQAKDMGANAIIAVKYDSNNISDLMQEIFSYGTAVVVEKEE